MPACSGLFALNWEISVSVRLHGGPGSTRTKVDCIGSFAKCDISGGIKQQKKSLTTVAPKMTLVPLTSEARDG
jgi:hypothetical protein